MPATRLSAVLLSLATSLAAASDTTSAPAAVLDTVVVTGEQPGPGLWQVRAPDGHVLWVVATLSPLPMGLRWRADEVEERIAAAGAVLGPPGARFDSGMGRLRSLLLVPSLLSARRNPDRQSLAEVLPAPLHARWTVLRERYLPGRRSVERWRPLFAAFALYEAAIERIGLRLQGVVWPVIDRARRRHDVPLVSTTLPVQVGAPRDALRDFARSPLDDRRCFELTLDRLEDDLGAMRQRGLAWAIGDLDTLRTLPAVDPGRACIEAVLASAGAARHGFDDLPARVRAHWLATAEQALAEHAQSLAMLPLSLVLPDDGFLADLGRRGYRVLAPDDPDIDDAADGGVDHEPGRDGDLVDETP